MDALHLLAECAARGVVLEPRGDRLGVKGPRVAVTALRDDIIAAKPSLLALLIPDQRPVGCTRCGDTAVWRRSWDGSAWCRRCDHRRELLDLAALAGYPRLDLRPTMLFIVPGQVGGWVEFVRNVAGATAYVARRHLLQWLVDWCGDVIPSDSPIQPWQE